MKNGMMNQREKEALDWYLTNPPDQDIAECPDCDGEIENDGYGWKCLDEECGWSAYPEDEE